MTNDPKKPPAKTVIGWQQQPPPQQPQNGPPTWWAQHNQQPGQPQQAQQGQPYAPTAYDMQPQHQAYAQQPYGQQPYAQQPHAQQPQYAQPQPQYAQQAYPQHASASLSPPVSHAHGAQGTSPPYASSLTPGYPSTPQQPPSNAAYSTSAQAYNAAYGAVGSSPAYNAASPAYGSTPAYNAASNQNPPYGASTPAAQPYTGNAAYDASGQPFAGAYPQNTYGQFPRTDQPPPARQPSPSDAGAGRPIANADATVGVSDRVRFIRLTYLHLLGAILLFAGLEYLLMTSSALAPITRPFVEFALGGRWNWGVVLGAFMASSYAAHYWANHTESRAMQYLGLLFYVLAEAVIFVPLLFIVEVKTADILAKGGGDPHIIRDSAFTTLALFGALTASVFLSKKDFSWLRSGLYMASSAALMLIFGSLAFGFNLGLVFSIGMVLLAAGYILFETSSVLRDHDPRMHVSAALELFASVALMFWYIIRIFLRARE